MKQSSVSILILLSVSTLIFAAEDNRMAKVVSVKEYDQGRIAYWEGRVPIFDHRPVYDITLSLGPGKYVVRYESPTGHYPSTWKVGSEIKVRLQGKGKIYLLDGAKEVRAEVVNARAQECVSSSGPPVGAGPQVPCE
jgi:hypothetical protein